VLPFLNALSAEPAVGKLPTISGLSDGVLESANSMVLVLESVSNSPASKLVNVAGRQKMLTQRLAKNYVLAEARADGGLAKAAMDADRGLILKSHMQLAAAPIFTPAIKESLEKSLVQFTSYASMLSVAGNLEPLSQLS
jgi:Type IV pili methyl-accepting chemotaxis transducer N-term